MVVGTDLKNRTGLSTYFWETEANGSHLLKGPPEDHSAVTETKIKTLIFSTESRRTKYVDWILIEWQSFPLLCSDATEIGSNLTAGGNNQTILWSSQNSLISNIYGWSCRKKYIGCILSLFQKPQSMICLQTPSFGWSFQDSRQLASKPVHHNNELLDPVLFLRSVVVNQNFGRLSVKILACQLNVS